MISWLGFVAQGLRPCDWVLEGYAFRRWGTWGDAEAPQRL